MAEISFVDGKAQGTAKEYYETGELHYIGELKDNRFINIEEFDKDGKSIKNINFEKKK